MKMIGSQMTAQFSTDWKSNPDDPAAGMRSTRKRSLPFSRMNSLRPAFTSQPSGTALPGAATNWRSERVATPQFRSPVSSTVTL